MALDSAAYLAAGGPILLGVLIGLGALLKWPKWTDYVWAAIAILWGVYTLVM